VESDKASMEIPSSHAGVVKELRVALGDKMNIGSPVLVLTLAGAVAAPAGAAAAAAAVAAPAAPAASVPATAVPAHQPTQPTGALPHASPSVRKFARELGVPLDEVKGSGPRAASRRKTCLLSSRP
jgi:pyruvate dehydrogenase E2 component (dihydrolipoamide acetyltransferase)